LVKGWENKLNRGNDFGWLLSSATTTTASMYFRMRIFGKCMFKFFYCYCMMFVDCHTLIILNICGIINVFCWKCAKFFVYSLEKSTFMFEMYFFTFKSIKCGKCTFLFILCFFIENVLFFVLFFDLIKKCISAVFWLFCTFCLFYGLFSNLPFLKDIDCIWELIYFYFVCVDIFFIYWRFDCLQVKHIEKH